jgi:quercetin dioxygenase-like cupin family protein
MYLGSLRGIWSDDAVVRVHVDGLTHRSAILNSLHGGLMRLVTRLGFVIVVISLTVVSSASHVAAQRQATTTVTRLFTGGDGQSHAEEKEVAWRPAKLRAELNESESVKVTGAQFLRWPRGFVWEGHPASKRQYVIIVSGRGEVDVVGGKTVQLAPGRVLLAEDVTGKGHTTRVGADEDLVMLLLPLAQEP